MSLRNLGLHVYADSGFADVLGTRFSTTGHVVFLAGGPIFWKSRKQTLVCLSSTESEFINLTPAGLSLLWIHNLLKDLGHEQLKPMIMFTDLANARLIALNPLQTARTRYIDIQYKWIIDRIGKGDFDIRHVGTRDMVADGLTKALPREKHVGFVRLLGLGPCPW